MSIFNRKKQNAEPVKTVLYKVEMNFIGPMNKSINQTYNHVVAYFPFVRTMEDGLFIHELQFGDGKIQLIRESEGHILANSVMTRE